MQKVKIFQPSKSAMSSGRGKMHRWKIEFEQVHGNFVEPLMGWVGQADTQQQVDLFFDSKDQAVAYAESNGFDYRVIDPQAKQYKPKSYANNFRFDQKRKRQ